MSHTQQPCPPRTNASTCIDGDGSNDALKATEASTCIAGKSSEFFRCRVPIILGFRPQCQPAEGARLRRPAKRQPSEFGPMGRGNPPAEGYRSPAATERPGHDRERRLPVADDARPMRQDAASRDSQQRSCKYASHTIVYANGVWSHSPGLPGVMKRPHVRRRLPRGPRRHHLFYPNGVAPRAEIGSPPFVLSPHPQKTRKSPKCKVQNAK